MRGGLTVNFDVLEQVAADELQHEDSLRDYGSQLRAKVSNLLWSMNGGMGAEDHEAAMQRADCKIEEHLCCLERLRQCGQDANDEYQGAGQRGASRLRGAF